MNILIKTCLENRLIKTVAEYIDKCLLINMIHKRDCFTNFQGGLGSIKTVHIEDSYYGNIFE